MDEYVKRETLLNSICNKHCNCDYDGECPNCRLTEMIQDALAADVAPVRHARWITWEEAGNDIPSPHRHECSACHDAAQVLINNIELLSDYCPNCGAKMDGAE
jgi:hypothetical protein